MSGAGRPRAEYEFDAVAAQDLADRLAQRGGLAREDALRALHEDRLAAETAHRLRDLDTDRPAAKHKQPARDGLHARRLAVGPQPVELAEPRDRGDDGVGAAGDDDVLGGVAHPADLDHTRTGEPAAAPQQVDAGVRQPALLPGVGVVRHHEVPPCDRRLDVDLPACRRLACTVHRLARPQQRL